MSLAEWVTPIEALESDSEGRRNSKARRLSFNPVDAWIPPTAEEPIGAFEVPKAKRIFQVIAAVIYCLLGAGIIFGYAAIKPVLINEGVYRDRCTPKEIEDKVRVCYDQELKLNFMFTCAAVATNVVALPVGTILDKYGPRACGIIGACSITIGCFFFAFAYGAPFDGYIPGYLFLALGGPMIFISSFQLSNTFPSSSGLILSMLTGAFDSSSAVFLFYRLIYDWSNGTFWPKKFFLAYLVVPAFILIAQIFLMPKLSYKTVGELVQTAEQEAEALDRPDPSDDDIDDPTQRLMVQEERRIRRESVVSEITELLGPKGGERHQKREAVKKEVSGVWGALHGKTAGQQIMSPWFLLITLFTVIQMTRINYFVATIRPQYEYIFGSYDKAVEINNFFDVALPLGGLIAVPFIGTVLDNLSTTIVLSILVSLATVIGILGVLPYTWAAYMNVAIFVVYRPFYYTTVSDYSAKVFGFETFGKVYGLIICLAGLFNFSQSVLDALTHKVFNNNPVPVNLILLSIAIVLGSSLVFFVFKKSQTLRREQLEDEAEGATEHLIPNGSGSNGV